jgi:FkbM family methyltransferase
MPMVSYAQNYEDVLLARAFPDMKEGFYIDVGANDPISDSVTKHFYDQGWHGINIEPVRALYERLCSHRGNDINLNIGLSNRESYRELIECLSYPGLSTFTPCLVDNWRRRGLEMQTANRSVPVMTLAQICEAHVDRTIDFLKIDVEGHEREVIEGGDFHKWRPRVILIEATWPERWEPLILGADYHFAIFDGLNRYYVRSEDRALLPALSVPVNTCDSFVSYHHHAMVEQLSAQLEIHKKLNDELSARLGLDTELGPNVIRIALKLRQIADRHPRLTSAIKRIARLAG